MSVVVDKKPAQPPRRVRARAVRVDREQQHQCICCRLRHRVTKRKGEGADYVVLFARTRTHVARS